MFKTLGVLTAAILIIILVIAGPFFVIWAWNTLTSVYGIPAIDYTFWTWLAVLILGTFIRSPVKISKQSQFGETACCIIATKTVLLMNADELQQYFKKQKANETYF